VLVQRFAALRQERRKALVVYVTAVHTPLYSEARYSLPAMPIVLLLATMGTAAIGRRKSARKLPPSQSHA